MPADVLAAQHRANVAAQGRKELRRKRRVAEKWKVRFAEEEVKCGGDGGPSAKGLSKKEPEAEAARRGGVTSSDGVPSWSPNDLQPLLSVENSTTSSDDIHRQVTHVGGPLHS